MKNLRITTPGFYLDESKDWRLDHVNLSIRENRKKQKRSLSVKYIHLSQREFIK